MNTVWILWVLLSTGAAGPVLSDEASCLAIERAIAGGQTVTAELFDGSFVEIVDATCERREEVLS